MLNMIHASLVNVLEHVKCHENLNQGRVCGIRDVGVGEGTSSILSRMVNMGLVES